MEIKDQVSIVIELAKVLGGILVFAIGLWQYSKAQRWKRREFLADRIREFEADQKVRSALTMIDWTGRSVADIFGKDFQTKHPDRRVDDALLYGALLQVKDGYTREETAIRDCFDALFDGLGRFWIFVKAGLVKKEELKPYFEYWAWAITALKGPAHSSHFRALVINYMKVHGFSDAQELLDSLAAKIHWGDHELEEALKQATVGREAYRIRKDEVGEVDKGLGAAG